MKKRLTKIIRERHSQLEILAWVALFFSKNERRSLMNNLAWIAFFSMLMNEIYYNKFSSSQG